MAKILVVEDERELNDILKASLNSEGYEVVAAFNGKEGLNAFSDNKIDLVLSDIMMPAIDGYQLCRMIKNMDETKCRKRV